MFLKTTTGPGVGVGRDDDLPTRNLFFWVVTLVSVPVADPVSVVVGVTYFCANVWRLKL